MRDARIMINKGRPCQCMTNTIRIKAIVPETVADDIVYYADDSGIYADGNELAVEAVRTMLMDATAGYMEELEALVGEYRAVLEAQRTVVFDIVVPVGLDERIRRLLPAIGYEMNMFVSIALMRRVNEVADYEDDETERFGEEYE